MCIRDRELRASILLLLAAVIWGFAFVAQKVGIQYIGSFTLNGVRFALGCISLIPLIIYFNKKTKGKVLDNSKPEDVKPFATVKAGVIMGLVLFVAASLQQIGMEETTAGKAAFITGFYIVLVPFF